MLWIDLRDRFGVSQLIFDEHRSSKELFEKANNPKYSYFPEDDDHMMNYNKQLLNKIKLFINKI